MKKILRITRGMWKKVDGIYDQDTQFFAGLGAFFASAVLIPVDLLLYLPIHLPHYILLNKRQRELLAGRYRKTRIEPFDIPRSFATEFTEDLLGQICLEFIEDQLRRKVRSDNDGWKEASILVDHKIMRTKAFAHLKFTHKTSVGQRQTFAAAHFFLELSIVPEDRVVHIERVQVVRDSSPKANDWRAEEFDRFVRHAPGDPLTDQYYPFSGDIAPLLRNRKPGADECGAVVDPVSGIASESE